MSEPMKFQLHELRPEVLAFALLMEQRLAEKDADKGLSWKQWDVPHLKVAMVSKASRMELAMVEVQHFNHPLSGATTKHAVDLANYCMMIADVAGALELPVDPAQQWCRDDKQTYYVLLLIGGHEVTQEAVASWSDEDCQLAENWAMATHLQASDNDDIEIPPVPSCVIPFLVR